MSAHDNSLITHVRYRHALRRSLQSDTKVPFHAEHSLRRNARPLALTRSRRRAGWRIELISAKLSFARRAFIAESD